MKILDKESGKVLGIRILQPEAVQTEYEKWRKKNYSHFWVFYYTTMFLFAVGLVGWYNNLHPLMDLIALGSFFMFLLVSSALQRQYNKQAPDGLKWR